MKFECDSCHAQYMIADEKVGKRGVKVKCKKCQHVIIVRPNKGEKSAAKAADAAADSAADRAPREEERASHESSSFDDGKTELGASAAPPPAPGVDSTLAGSPPDGIDELRRDARQDGADQDGASDGDPFAPGEHSGFAAGGPTDPAMAALAPPPPASDEESAATGNHRAPAPISMFGDTTQLSAQVAPSVPDAPPATDRTELAAPPQMTVPPPPEAPAPPVAAPAGNDDILSDQLSGAFSAMFDSSGQASQEPVPDDGDQRGPTRVLDADAMAALRKKTAQRTTEGSPDDGGPPGALRGEPPDLASEGFVVKPPAGADDGPAEQVWHVAIDEQDVGPLSVAEVGRHIEGGRVDRDTLVWKMGMDNWEPAAEVPEIRALFDKVPMPRIQVEDERPRARASAAPELSDEPSAGRSPFDEAPDDPAWRPHGLTDVYQAANLAEAAAGMGLGSIGSAIAPKPSSSTASMSAQASMDSEWRPGAASALASLVQDEIKRIDSPLPPADDDLRPADDASINAPLFGGMSARAELDAGPEITDPMASRPPLAQRSTYEPPPVSPSFPPQPGFQTRPPAEAGKKVSPLLIGGIAGGGGLFLAIAILIGVVAFRDGDQPKLVLGPDGKPYMVAPDGKLVAMAGSEDKGEKGDKSEKKVEAKAADAATDAPKAPTPDAPTPTPGTATDAPVAVAPDGAAPAAPVAAATDAPVADKPAESDKPVVKKATTSTKRTEKAEKPEKADKPALETKAPTKGCDPVLDFDCKPGGAATKRPEQNTGPLPDTPSKADVLVVVKSALPKVAACGKKTGQSGMISMQWTIAPSGKVTSASPKDKHAGTPTGTCVAGVIKGLKFPASKKGIPVTFPMKLN